MAEYLVLDVSRHQGQIDWNKVKPHIGGVIIQVGYGNDDVTQDDKWGNYNIKECERLGIPWGGYLYSHATNDAMLRSEYAHMKRLMKGHKSTYPWYLDIEENACRGYARRATELWSELCKSDGNIAGIYTGTYYFNTYIKGTKVTCSWWIAAYGYNTGRPELNFKPNIGIPIDGWQYTSEGKIDGIRGNVDLSLFYKDYSSGVKPSPSPAPAPSPAPTNLVFTYSARIEGGRILPAVNNLADYAGLPNKKITDLAIKVNQGSVRYRAHVLGGEWLPWVTGYNWNDFKNGFAGIGKPIDCVQVELSGVKGQKAQYRVAPLGRDYYAWQYNTETGGAQDGFAGAYGRAIDKFQVY